MSTGGVPLLNGRISRELKATALAKGNQSHLAAVKLLSDFFTVWCYSICEKTKGPRSEGKAEEFKSEMRFKSVTIGLASQLGVCRF